MKKLFFVLSFLFVCLAMFCQTAADSTFAGGISQAFGWDISIVLTVLGVISWLIGHFFVNGKWWSYLAWIEKVVYALYQAIHWLNEKTNKGQADNKK